MKKTLLIAVLIITGIFGGCSKVSESAELQKARHELESHNYDVALDILTEIINDDPDNKSARAMYMQGRKMSSALNHEQNQDYDKAIADLNDIVNINNGSNLIKKESIKKKEELEKLQAKKEEDALKRKENAKKASKKYIQNSESTLIYEQEEEEDNYEEEKDKIEETLPPKEPGADKEENTEGSVDNNEVISKPGVTKPDNNEVNIPQE